MIRNIQVKTCVAQRQRKAVQRLQATTPPFVIEDAEELSGVSQRRNTAIQEPREEAMPPSIHFTTEAKMPSRGRNMSAWGPGTTMFSHVIQNVQEKTRKAQR